MSTDNEDLQTAARYLMHRGNFHNDIYTAGKVNNGKRPSYDTKQ